MPTETKRHWRKKGWLISLTFCLAFLLGYTGLGAAASVAVVDASSLNVRSGPGPQHGISDRVIKGDQLPLLEQRGDWYKVRLASGSAGWVAGWLVNIKEEAPAADRTSKQVVIKTGILNVREGPGTGNAQVGTVHNGDKLQVLESSGDWYKVKLPSGSSGWVAGWLVDVETIQAPETGTGQLSQNTENVNKQAVVNGTLNVRSGPGTSNDIVARAESGDKLPIIESSGGWCKVQLPGGKTGWVAGWLVDIKGTAVPGTNSNIDTNTDNGQSNGDTENISKQVVVKEGTLNVRSGPGTSNDIVARVKEGDKLPIVESSDGWCKVQLPGGGMGWVAGWLVDIKAIAQQQSPVTGEAVVYGSDANVRGGPGADHNVITQVSRGERMTILGKVGEWYKVQSSQGAVGWIAGWLVRIDSASATTPEKEEKQPEESESDGDPSDSKGTDEKPGSDAGSEPDPDSGEEPGQNEEDAANPQLTKLHVRESDGRVMVNIAATVPMEHNIFTLTGPDRLVVDLIGVKPGDIPEELDVSSKLVSRLRTGWFDKNPNTVRLVFDVKDSILFSAQSINDGRELALEMYVPELGDSLRNKVIAIDPGHGGSEPGTHGSTGIAEKYINLDVALLTAHLLRQNGARVVLTRSEDTFVGLEERTEIARRAGADIFVSIHMNANPVTSKSGTSTYYRRDDITGLGVSQADNLSLARGVQGELLKSLGRRDLGVKQANFVVLRTAVMPAVLAEVSFLSNLEEERLLMTDSYKARAAEGITKGIVNYFARKGG